MSYGTVNCDVVQSSVSGVSLGAGNASIMKNRIINGAMVIDQRNAGASVTPANGGFGTDRWKFALSQASKLTCQQTSTAPVGFTKSLAITSSSAYTVGSTELFLVSQLIEGFNIADLGWGTANAKTVTLSFWVRSSLTGTFGGAVKNSNAGVNDRSYPFSYTISVANTWEQKTITIAGDTTGTWATDNTAGLVLSFGLGVGSTLSNTAGAWVAGAYHSATGATSVVGTNGATFYITGVQLEVGSSATGFEYRQYQQELALCQRFLPAYSANGSSGNTPQGVFVQGTSTTKMWGQFIFPVTTRTAPTGVTISSVSHFIGAGQTSNMTLSAINFQFASTSSASCNFDGSGGTSTQNIVLISQNASALIYFTGCEL